LKFISALLFADKSQAARMQTAWKKCQIDSPSLSGGDTPERVICSSPARFVYFRGDHSDWVQFIAELLLTR
jgi:hypothetical protein